MFSSCGKVFSRELIGETRFPDGARIGEDQKFIFDLLLKTYPEIDPEHTLFIDDMERNCIAGAQAGLITLCLPAEGDIAGYLEFTEE